jgi:hypothetical protein
LEVILSIDNEGRKGERCKVTYSGFFGGRVLDDLRAEIRRFDGAEILLVGFA